jgi:hypothetical protein
MGAMDSLAKLRPQLLELHRSLVESQRIGYERVHGRTSAADFLQVLINDPAFAWLKPLTGLVAQLDEVLASNGEFQRRYRDELHQSPDVALAHGKLKQR